MMIDFLSTRREFLKGGGAMVVSFAIAARHASVIAQTGAGAAKSIAADEVDSFLAIGADGKVTVYSGKVDLGTGVRTALMQIAAEELDVPLDRVTVIQGDTALTPDQGPTYGSLSIQNGGVQIRQAAATAKRHLIDLASQKLGAAADELIVEDGVIKPKSGGKGVGYSELIGGKNFALKLDKEAKTKDQTAFKVVGKPIPRVDIPEKCTGRFTYMQDASVEGMAHGRVVRPPALGAMLQSVDESSVKNIPGLVKIVREGNFLGVVAETEWGAIKAAQNLRATWSQWDGLPEQKKLYEHVRATKINKDDVTSNIGNVQEALTRSAKTLKATYDFAIHTHGSIGPSCAIVEIKEGQLTCWTASQATHNLKKQLAAMMNLPVESVRCIYIEGSGCYGRNGHEDAAGDATLLARAVGRPVRVQWMRADEHGWDPKGPPTLIDLRAQVLEN
jgi:nicotinate dehydrogenase subunit B